MNNASNLSTKKILVVEDNLVNRKVLMKQIQIMGYDVAGVVNGQEAVEYWQNHQVDLMLMDCQMPVMDGYEATDTLRQLDHEKQSLVIVGLTANTLPGDRQKCLNAGMDDYLPKPAFQKDLAMIFDKWLGCDAETVVPVETTAPARDITSIREAMPTAPLRISDNQNPSQYYSSTELLAY
ncbi:MAG: response regulator [Limnothrix sp. RL_2_0]|nr:response regulator [Limnothrix sp. RL_2_0]